MRNIVYKVIYSDEALNNIRKFDKRLKDRISNKIKVLSYDLTCNNNVKRLKGYSNLYRLRIGDYRALFSLYANILTIEIVKIKKRSEVYRKC